MGFKEQAARTAGKFLKGCVDNNGMFLFLSAAAGWALGSTAQTIGLMTNKNIGKEEKKFLVPQEILDGAFNVLSYAAVTLPLMSKAKKLAVAKFPNKAEIASGASTLAAIAGGIISSNIITPVLRNKSSVRVKNIMDKKRADQKLDVVSKPDELSFPKSSFALAPDIKTAPLDIKSYMQLTKIPTGGSLRV